MRGLRRVREAIMHHARPPIRFRGSRRRVRQLRMRDHWSVEMSWLLAGILIGVWLAVRVVRNDGGQSSVRDRPEMSAAEGMGPRPP